MGIESLAQSPGQAWRGDSTYLGHRVCQRPSRSLGSAPCVFPQALGLREGVVSLGGVGDQETGSRGGPGWAAETGCQISSSACCDPAWGGGGALWEAQAAGSWGPSGERWLF